MRNQYALKVLNWYQNCFVSGMPILSPLSGGKAMSVSPKILFAHLWMLFLGEDHEDGCTCEVCQYRRDTTNIDQVHGQRQSAHQAFCDLRTQLSSYFHSEEGPRVSSDEAFYWMQWMKDNFPASVGGVGGMSLVHALDDLPVSRLGEVLLGHAIDHCPSLNLTEEEYDWLWDAMASVNGDPAATQELLLTVASMQFAGQEL